MANKQTPIEAPSPFTGDRDLDLDVKEKVEHLDNVPQEEDHVALKSEFDNLTAWQALKTFKVVSLYCVAAAFSAATDGYQVRLALWRRVCCDLVEPQVLTALDPFRSISTGIFWPTRGSWTIWHDDGCNRRSDP